MCVFLSAFCFLFLKLHGVISYTRLFVAHNIIAVISFESTFINFSIYNSPINSACYKYTIDENAGKRAKSRGKKARKSGEKAQRQRKGG